ncbi:hypothetical protein [Salipaludibacillus agaradhaerens]|uniref:hypothetical protein n=1 Tax=Salipaludibacillus agaradhaerens TaxID=76935 RepID=UPI000996D30F|nr:hypothetical protein [Salipaludibacillus agaradhaerens]
MDINLKITDGEKMEKGTSGKLVVKDTTSIGGWLLVATLTIIPIVNVITFLAFAFSDEHNRSLKNYARAGLISLFIGVMTVFIVGIGLQVDFNKMVDLLPDWFTYLRGNPAEQEV